MQHAVADVYKRDYARRASFSAPDERNKHALARMDARYFNVPAHERNRETFSRAVGMYLQNNTNRRGHIEFIKQALKHLEEFSEF